MKKVLLVIDENVQIIEADSVQILYNTIDDCDIALIISAKEPLADTTQEKQVAVPRPSVVGIEMAAKFSTNPFIKDVPESLAILNASRASHGIPMLALDPKRDSMVPNKRIALHTKFYEWNAPDAITNCITELVACERHLLEGIDEFLVVETEPRYIFSDDGLRFRLQEAVSVYVRKPVIEEPTIISPESAPVTAVTPAPSSEESELIEIFEDLFRKNSTQVQYIIKKDFDADSHYNKAVEFFMGQATLATGGKISRTMVRKVLDELVEALNKVTQTIADVKKETPNVTQV